MKKILFSILILTLFIGTSYAETCSAIEKKDIINHASNIRFTFVPSNTFNGDSELKSVTDTQRYIDIKIYNVTTDVYFTLKGNAKNTSLANDVRFDYNKIGPDGTITIRMESIDKVANLVLEIYTYTPNCNGDKIRTINLKVPKYNYYSQLEACSGIPEFYLCQEYIDFDIDGTKFYDQVGEYRDKKENPEDDVVIDNIEPAQHNIFVEKKSYVKHIIFGVVTVVAVVSGYFILKRKKHEPEIW